ncbi:hypothetical protein ABIE28_001177 [Devosia sp. 2618]
MRAGSVIPGAARGAAHSEMLCQSQEHHQMRPLRGAGRLEAFDLRRNSEAAATARAGCRVDQLFQVNIISRRCNLEFHHFVLPRIWIRVGTFLQCKLCQHLPQKSQCLRWMTEMFLLLVGPLHLAESALWQRNHEKNCLHSTRLWTDIVDSRVLYLQLSGVFCFLPALWLDSVGRGAFLR